MWCPQKLQKQILDVVAQKLDLTKVLVSSVINTLFDAVIDEVAKGSKVSVAGFGIFEAKARKERIGRNPKTGEEIKIEASVTPNFKAGENFKSKVSSGNE